MGRRLKLGCNLAAFGMAISSAGSANPYIAIGGIVLVVFSALMLSFGLPLPNTKDQPHD